MLSRVAESVYWMNRYLERAENVARFIDVNQNLTLGESDHWTEPWAPLVSITGDHASFAARFGAPTRTSVLDFLACDRDNPNSIVACVAKARENARSIREVISTPIWEQLNKFHLLLQATAQAPQDVFHDTVSFCERVKTNCHTLVGISETTMSHGEPWHFARLGRLVERADKTSRIIDVQYFLLLPSATDVGGTLDVVRWSALLKSTSALEMYRRQHGRIVPTAVADFLILNHDFPRSIHFCIARAQESLRLISGSQTGTFHYRSEKIVGRLRSELDYMQIRDIIDRGMHEFIDDFQTRLNDLGTAISADFFVRDEAA